MLSKKVIGRIALGLFVLLIFLNFPWICQGHGGHSHDDHEHSHEPASFKYSKTANEEHAHSTHSHDHHKSILQTKNIYKKQMILIPINGTALLTIGFFFHRSNQSKGRRSTERTHKSNGINIADFSSSVFHSLLRSIG